MNKPVAIHLCERLQPGGVARVMAHLATLHNEFAPVLAGWQVDAGYAQSLSATGALIASVDDEGMFTPLPGQRQHPENTPALADLSGSVVVVHRAGNSSAEWNRLIAACRRRGARAVVEYNHFGHADPGADGVRFDHAFFVSLSALRRHWRGLGCPSVDEYLKTHEVLYNPVLPPPDPARMRQWRADFRTTLGLRETDVLFVSLLRPDPGRIDAMIPEVMRAFKTDQRIHLAVRQLPKPLVDRARRLLGDRFHDLPFSSAENDIWQTLAAADAMVHFSSMGESFGMAIAEAMRCGLPVVTAPAQDPRHSNGQTELVLPGQTGFLTRTPSETACAIRGLADDAALRSRLGAGGKQRFETEDALWPEWIIKRFETELAAVGNVPTETGACVSVSGAMPGADVRRRYLQRDLAADKQGACGSESCAREWFDWIVDARRFLWRVRRKWGKV